VKNRKGFDSEESSASFSLFHSVCKSFHEISTAVSVVYTTRSKGYSCTLYFSSS